jgi:hypothetical protein
MVMSSLAVDGSSKDNGDEFGNRRLRIGAFLLTGPLQATDVEVNRRVVNAKMDGSDQVANQTCPETGAFH